MSYSKKAIGTIIGVIVIFTMILTACAPQAAPAPAQPKEVEKIVEKTVVVEKQVVVTPTAGPAKKYEGQTLNMLAGQPHIVGCRNLAKWFEEESGAHVNCLAVPFLNIPEKAMLDVTSGSGEYDIVQYWYPSLGQLTESGVLSDLTEWWDSHAAEFKTDDIIPGYLDPYTLYNGKRMGIPYDGDQHLLFYNTTIFKKYNIAKAPETWDEYLTICKTITEGEKASGGDAYGCGIMATKFPLIIIGTFLNRLATYGGGFFDADGKPTVNSPEAVAALEELMKEIPYALPDPKAVGFDEMLGPWNNGKVGMVEFWTDLGQMADNPEQSKIKGEWDVAPMPKGPAPKGRIAAPMNAGWGLGLSTKSAQKELALEYLAFVMRPETNVRLNTVLGGIDPIRKSCFDDQRYIDWVTPKLAAAAKASALSSLVAWPNGANWTEEQDILTENLALVLTNEKTPKQALDATQAEWEKIAAKK
jgi:multiple sugar transport system substrate-binding protein